MSLVAKPASVLTWDQLADLFNTAFKNYIGNPINLTGESLAAFCPANYVSIPHSYVYYEDDSPTASPVAFTVMSLRDDRPHESRLMSMGVIPTSQAKGLGGKALQAIIEKERQRGVKILELECILQNERGMRLYERNGFKSLRELWGFNVKPWTEQVGNATGEVPKWERLEEITLDEVEAVMAEHGSGDIPWQARGFIKLAEEGSKAFKLNGNKAYGVIGNPDGEDKSLPIKIWCLIVKPAFRSKKLGSRLAKAVMRKYPDRKFMNGIGFPREVVEVLTKGTGLEVEVKELKLAQMRLDLV